MSFFALDFEIEMPYSLAPPQGREVVWIFKNLVISIQQSAKSNPCSPRRRGDAKKTQPRAAVLHERRRGMFLNPTPNSGTVAQTYAKSGMPWDDPSEVHANLG
jgi:hypothetical protein